MRAVSVSVSRRARSRPQVYHVIVLYLLCVCVCGTQYVVYMFVCSFSESKASRKVYMSPQHVRSIGPTHGTPYCQCMGFHGPPLPHDVDHSFVNSRCLRCLAFKPHCRHGNPADMNKLARVLYSWHFITPSRPVFFSRQPHNSTRLFLCSLSLSFSLSLSLCGRNHS